ncbi:hypothetical protein K9O30_09480 [Clostridium bowmanii]|uniref:hypothetical protein n=1 Tax=Clostridium bowmanii TaxID=132925 RepID=UPI001C0DD915|nr:hypothetical protein [Clostridium bowmanii]MBU3189331.1 hypothetical protein [Clostridium bowmanii]MCA1073947.1 hypothetical protein [Clostridium bowmanii]
METIAKKDNKKIIQTKEDMLYSKYIREKVERAEEDFKNGRYITSDQLREESKTW